MTRVWGVESGSTLFIWRGGGDRVEGDVGGPVLPLRYCRSKGRKGVCVEVGWRWEHYVKVFFWGGGVWGWGVKCSS